MKSGDPARNVRILFLLALLVLFVPSRLMALAHGANVAGFAGATLSTLMAGVLLCRMCLRARHHTWFSIVSIPALYVSTFGAPLSGWGTLLALYVIRRLTIRRADSQSKASQVARPETPARDVASVVDDADGSSARPLRAIDLEPLCRLYRPFLFSQRIGRAALASRAGSFLLAGPRITTWRVTPWPRSPARESGLDNTLMRDFAVASRRVAGVTVDEGCVNAYVTRRPPSQVEFEVTLPLALEKRKAASTMPAAQEDRVGSS